MNEKYGIEIDLITIAFNKKIKQIQEKTKKIKNIKIKIDFDKTQISNLSKNLKSANAQFEKMIKNCKTLQKELNKKYSLNLKENKETISTEDFKNAINKENKIFNPNDVSGMKINGLSQIKGISNEFKKLTSQKIDLGNAVELQKYKQGLQAIGDKAKEVKEEVSNVGYVSYNTDAIQQYINKYGQVENKVKNTKEEVKVLNNEVKKSSRISVNINKFGTGLDKVISKIKRFTLSLFSIRSAYALVSKASSAYLSQDTQLTNKLQAVWVRITDQCWNQ